jgi:hypothetical protein
MLLIPPIRRRILASHSRASLCSIGAGFMELVVSRATFNPEIMSFEYSLNLLGTLVHEKRDVLAAFLPRESTKGLLYFLQIIYRPFDTVFIQNILI